MTKRKHGILVKDLVSSKCFSANKKTTAASICIIFIHFFICTGPAKSPPLFSSYWARKPVPVGK